MESFLKYLISRLNNSEIEIIFCVSLFHKSLSSVLSITRYSSPNQDIQLYRIDNRVKVGRKIEV
jgi:hypothetical protein